MIYKNTVLAMQALLSETTYVTRDQMLLFFGDSTEPENNEYYLKHLRLNRVFDQEKGQDLLLKNHASPEIDFGIRARMIRAFWPIAYVGSTNIQWIHALKYPIQYEFLDIKNRLYDLSVVSCDEDAYLIRQEFMKWLPPGGIAPVHHIIIVDNDDTGIRYQEFGFHSYCVLEDDNMPRFVVYSQIGKALQ